MDWNSRRIPSGRLVSSVGPFSHELGSFYLRSEVGLVPSAWKGENTNYLPRL